MTCLEGCGTRSECLNIHSVSCDSVEAHSEEDRLSNAGGSFDGAESSIVQIIDHNMEFAGTSR